MYIRERPTAYRLCRPPFRFARTRRFRCFLVYAVANGTIVIYRVRHIHQRTLKRYTGP